MTLRGSWSSTVLSITSFRTIRRPSGIQGLSQLDGYKRGLVNPLTGNPQKSGLDRVPQRLPCSVINLRYDSGK